MLPAARSPLAPRAGVAESGAIERWTVLGAFPTAVYLHRHGSGVLAVVTSDGLALPTAWRLAVPSRDVEWGVSPGDQVGVSTDRITLPLNDIHAVRAWRPARVRRRSSSRVWLRASWFAERIGRGEGLTPEGDDEICGALLVAYAVGDPALAAAVLPLLPRTTALSASLIEAAAQGYAVPPLVAFVDAVTTGDPMAAARRPAVAAIGHTSGAALLRGVDLALTAVGDHPAYDLNPKRNAIKESLSA